MIHQGEGAVTALDPGSDAGAAASSGGLLLFTLCCPWPDRREQGLYNLDQVTALKARGVPASIFAPGVALPQALGHAARFRSHLRRPERYELEGVTIHAPRVQFAFPRPLRTRVRWMGPSRVGRWLESAVENELDHVIEAAAPSALLFHGAIPWSRAALGVAERHGLAPYFIEHSQDDLKRAGESKALAQEYQWANERAAGWVTVSETMGESLQQVVPEGKVHIIGNGAKALSDPRPRPQAFDGKTVVLSAGHYYPRKGFEAMAKAFAAASQGRSDLHWVIATDPPRALRRMIDALGSRATLIGPQPHDSLLEWMGWADLFALPSRNEAFGIVYAEALLAGTPILLSGKSGMASSLGLLEGGAPSPSHDGWAVDPGDHSGIARALAAASSSPSVLAAMGESAKARASGRFDWDRNAKDLAAALGLTSSQS